MNFTFYSFDHYIDYIIILQEKIKGLENFEMMFRT